MLNPNTSTNGVTTRASLQPMGFTDILDTIFSLYQNHFQLILSICAVYFALTLGINLLTGISTFFFESSGLQGMVIVTGFAGPWVATMVGLFPIGALLFAGAQAYLGKQITAGAAFGQATHRFLSYFGSSLLMMLIIGLLAITIIGIPFAIYLGVRWGFYAQAVLIEEHSATNALRRSRELVRGAWWRVFGIMLTIFLLAFMIQTVLQFSLLFVFGFTEEISGEEGLWEMFRRMFAPELTAWDELVTYVIQSCINYFVTSLMLPLTVIGITLLYFDRRIRKEGFDIEMDVTNEEDSTSGSMDILPRGDERNY